jgi:hypothetical protein
MEASGSSHERIAELEYVNQETYKTGRASRVDMHDWLKNDKGQAFVTDTAGDKVYVYPRENEYGTKYVQTYADKTWKDNLLYLPQYY